jgi:hypothetical protein
MLTTAQQSQLTAWLGQGPFTQIFTHVPGDGKVLADLLAATNGMGATFTVLTVSGSAFGVQSNLPVQLIGGYNPFGWVTGSHDTPADAQRTAFIFNLTNNTSQAQNLIAQGAPDSGKSQTVAASGTIGIQFGGPAGDIFLHWELYLGWATNYSYGGTSYGAPITFGGADPQNPSKDCFQVTQVDVYTFGFRPQAPSNAKVTIGT